MLDASNDATTADPSQATPVPVHMHSPFLTADIRLRTLVLLVAGASGPSLPAALPTASGAGAAVASPSPAAIVTSSAVGSGESAIQDTIRARVDLVIGEAPVAGAGRATAEHIFGAISGIAVDRQGRIYATDLQQVHVAVFSPAGTLLTVIGRKGQGPGEFEGPSGPALAPDGALYVRDISGVARFVVDPATALATRHDRNFRGPLFPDWMSRRASRVDAAGRVHHPVSEWRDGQLVRHRYLRYSAQGTFIDTLHVPPYENTPEPTASIRTSPNGGRMVRGLNHVPFAAIPVWEVTPAGTVISGDGRSYLLVETDATGRIVRRFERSVPLAQIPASERADSARALARRIDSLPVPITQPSVRGVPADVKAQRLPTTYPAYMAVFVADDGRVWVRRWPPPGRRGESFFDVFDPAGRHLGTVVLPVRLAAAHHPVIGTEVLVGVTIDEETDLESIVRARFRAP